MNSKLLIISGPTATGKTSLALSLAKIFDGELISADSRQVYKELDIGTGKEWGSSPIWGYDLVEPDQEYSVSAFNKMARGAVKDIWKRKKLPILVGGTGLYIKSVVDGIDTVSIPQNKLLREVMSDKFVDQLYDKLAILDSSKAASMNLSDRKNPRRLIRAIEIATWNIENTKKSHIKKKGLGADTLFVGLGMDTFSLNQKIKKRVDQRMENGFIFEVETLLKKGIGWNFQSMDSLGYKESELFLKKGLSYEEFIELWASNEIKYAKRQMTWFKKDPRIVWFDVEDANYPDRIVKMVKKWYSSGNKTYAKKN